MRYGLGKKTYFQGLSKQLGGIKAHTKILCVCLFEMKNSNSEGDFSH